ncbi:MAG: Ppx/GppA family phosphatase [Betaproteobacteria bacterium]|nr:Ppx/GppA family phosphatase [Betaproteobacteria bacterium]NBU48505.1 Ppx/GppA family phosphatase [Betaproteobacteria bacterium]
MDDASHILDAPLAAIDMGSNSFRIEIARIRDGRYRRLDYLKEPVRLGSGLDENGYLRSDAVDRGLATLAAMAELLRLHEVREVRAVATQTLREARNRNQFLTMAEPVLGLPIEVISGREEARLIFAGVAHLNPSDKPRLVIDIGGRSTEFVMGHGLKPGAAESFGIGSQSMTQRYFGQGVLSAEAFRAAQVAAGAEFEEAEKIFTPDRWSEVLASSGTAGAVSALLAAQGVTDGRLTPSALAWCIERCVEAGHTDRLELRGLKDERKPVLAGGLAILYTLMVQFRIDEIQPSRAALRQGVIFDLHQRRKVSLGVDASDVRDATVAQLQQRFEVDVQQANRVKHLALNLQRQMLPDLADEEVRELAWACDLHEIGLMVSHHDHHRHSAYLLDHLDAAGFSQSQQRRIGELVLGQRGGLRKVEAGFARKDFAMVLLCLRLAVLCCHGRHHGAKVKLHVQRDRQGGVGLSWGYDTQERGLTPAEQRTQHLLREEVSMWLKSGLLVLYWTD